MVALDSPSDIRITPHLAGIKMIKCSHSKLNSGYINVFNTLFNICIESSHYLVLEITLFGTGMNEKGNTNRYSLTSWNFYLLGEAR